MTEEESKYAHHIQSLLFGVLIAIDLLTEFGTLMGLSFLLLSFRLPIVPFLSGLEILALAFIWSCADTLIQRINTIHPHHMHDGWMVTGLFLGLLICWLGVNYY